MAPIDLRPTVLHILGAVLLVAALTGVGGLLFSRAGSLPDPTGPGPDGPLPPAGPAATDARPWVGSPTTSSSSGRLVPDVGVVTDAAPLGSGWILLDGPARRVHRVDADGAPTGSFGGPGDGPGEFRSPVGLAVVGDTIAVVEAAGSRMHLVSSDGAFLARRDLDVRGCPTRQTLDAEGSTLGPVLLLRCFDGSGAVRELAVLAAFDGPARILHSWPRPGDRSTRTLFDEPLLAAGGTVVALGRRNRRCVVVLDVVQRAPPPTERRCLPSGRPVPLEAEDRGALRSYFDGLASRTSIRVRVPENHPRIYGLFVVNGRPVALVPAPDRRLALVEVGRAAVDPIPVPAGETLHVSDESILQTHEELHGIRISALPLPPA